MMVWNSVNAQQWTKVSPTLDPPGDYNTYYGTFIDGKNGWWLAGPNASVLRTTNSGSFWKVLANNIVSTNIEFIDTLIRCLSMIKRLG